MTIYKQHLSCKDCKEPMTLFKVTRTNIKKREYFHCPTCEAQAIRAIPLKGKTYAVQTAWLAPNLPYEETEQEVVVEHPSHDFYPLAEGQQLALS